MKLIDIINESQKPTEAEIIDIITRIVNNDIHRVEPTSSDDYYNIIDATGIGGNNEAIWNNMSDEEKDHYTEIMYDEIVPQQLARYFR